jgi:putative addiction module killer protein
MNTLIKTAEFDAWLSRLTDKIGKARILARLNAAIDGNFGDWKAVSEGVSEMRIHAGPGYRVYYFRQASTVYVFLAGGDKSTQQRDIARAIEMAKALKRKE